MMLNKRKMAIISGLALIAMALAAGYAYGYVYGGLIDMKSPQDTYRNLQSSGTLFRNGMVAWGGIVVLDLLVAGSLHGFLKEVHFRLSVLTALIRILYAFILLAAVVHLVDAISLVEAAAGATEVMLALQRFETIWSQGLILFGFHLLGLGLLVIRDSRIPSIFGWLLLFAGCCYTGIHMAKFGLPDHAQQIEIAEMIASLPMAFAEIGFAFWLLFRAGRQRFSPPFTALS
ncbi:DUF4386 domain-containing protein [Cyclobacterium plantarum]|uniref:DUF4386 domain-containing protein n=1 Tax=Cyclobacterium plantarum TaxID=2716263 RepID=UPI003F6F8F02